MGLLGCFEPVGVRSGADDVASERQPVDDRSCEPRVGEGVSPLAEGCVRSASNRCSFFSGSDDLEQEFGAAGVEFDVADLVETKQIQARVFAHQA